MSALALKRLRTLPQGGLMGPAAALFLSANIANAANLLFNMVFARLMGPAAFADLTLLLTLKLGILSFLGALQFAFAQQVAKSPDRKISKKKSQALSWRSLKVSIPITFIVIASADCTASALNFSSPLALIVLALAIPFFLPMVIYRGLTQGLIDVPKIIFSIQAEWVIRLVGSVILWKMGLGLSGIAAAVGLSILAGFVFSTDKQDRSRHEIMRAVKKPYNVKVLAMTAMPYLILQVAQVVVLDSDIIIAKTLFTPQMAGLVAGLLLIQRVFFFAFLSCSTILQPYVARQSSGEKSMHALFTLLGAIAIISIIALMIIIPNSNLLVSLMLGENFAQLSSIVWISALTGAVFIVSHLCAVYQIAKGQNFAAKVVLAFGTLQLISLSVINHLFPDMTLHSYFSIKLAIQTMCALCLISLVLWPKTKKVSKG